MANDLYINGKKVDSFGDWSPQTEHPAIAIQRQEHDKRIELEQSLKMSPKEITFVSPEPQEMPDICKTQALLELEREYYPQLKEQRIRLDIAYDAVKNFEETSKPSEYDIAYEIKSNPFIYYEGNFNDGFGTAIEDVPKVLQSIPEGFRLIDVRQALRGSGQFILMSDKTDEEILQLAEANLTKHYSDKLDKLKQKLKKELDSMKAIISEYESQKKIAMQADIEQLVKISTKYAKVL
ncbi:transposase [Salmonella enterica]|uniref:transposase n=1 Tax=Escherichia coli TaxID=562 RepID=UPI000B7CB0D7|nr:transposase [Escherichia coli]EAC1924316.1 transposase [Salmonella enterica subsp. enterica serovar Anatum]EAP8710271.1 transposase [Salmonella enterica]EBZ1571111.1 transposase [Salmonella enterica subsp. enterica serovar Litchfield]ECA9188058.1 transposase [Salmonella enterica subsp. enterica serovar Reading]ECB5717678.1 transposase [Salmonella enterica subsp. enterica serovar Eko]ECJ0597007.1 transposase [Salmonella enterica subsp. enterica]ECP7562239.1 transposase [Salmonella enterica